jgi:beta-phosphoglucomutase-like phosphatase (HAD superfamily)
VKGYEQDTILIDGLERLKDKGFILALHSHSSEEYCTQILHTMGLTHVFPQQNIYHRGRVPHYKSEVEAHLFVQESLQEQYGDNAIHIMVDDMVENLRAAHYAGSKTVLNGTSRPADARQIDFNYPDIHKTLDALNTFTPECLLQMTG